MALKYMMEQVIGELRCPICLDFYSQPIILPCSHILCRAPCAERLFTEMDLIRCPVCRDNSYVSGGIDTLPRVISLENIIEQYRNPPPIPDPTEEDDPGEECGPDDIPCQLCPDEPVRRATKSCLHCNASYCTKCLRMSHPAKEPFMSHQLVEPRRYPKPKELRCPHHEAKVNIYCQDCQVLGCLLCADDPNGHPNHRVLSLEQATDMFKDMLAENLEKLTERNSQTQDAIHSSAHKLTVFQSDVNERKSQIQEQCDSLINEIETRRNFFLSDLEYEEKSKSDTLNKQMDKHQARQTHIQSLIHYTQAVLKENDQCAFLQLAKSLSDKIKKCLIFRGQISASPMATTLHHKIVDLRKERAVLRDMNYLTVPNTPVVNMAKCSRSIHSVVLVLCSPEHEYEVLDGYRVYYSMDKDTDRDTWDTMEFKSPGEERKYARGPTSANGVCLIHDNLQSGTMYYFSVRAYNLAGESEMSPMVNCTTLAESHITFPVPVIVENLCRTYSCSIQIHSPTPLETADRDEEIYHYLLYREASANKIWRSIILFGRVDHRVFGLESDTMYDFVIMSCNEDGECQVSNSVTLQTERTTL